MCMTKFITSDIHSGVGLIAVEREKQIEEDGFDAGHDRDHVAGELSAAAACYAVNKSDVPGKYIRVVKHTILPRDPSACGYRSTELPDAFPWSDEFDKRDQHDRLRSLVIAGALIAAEIDRLLL